MTTLRALCIAAVLGAFATTAASAQQINVPVDTTETNRPPIIPFLEGTDVFWTVQRSDGGELAFPNRLEADIFPHLVVVQNFTDVVNIEKQTRRDPRNLKEFAYSISGTPAVRIRMLRETSAPVRTPSYMPRANVQFIWARGLKDAAASVQTSPTETTAQPVTLTVLQRFAALSRISLWEAHLIVGHHSNGQDGCLSRDQQRIPEETGECLPADVQPTAQTVNRIDGSFSTNYLRAGINYSRNWMTGTTELQAVKEVRVRTELEYHPRPWIDDDIEDLFGRARLHVGGAYAVKNVRLCRKRLEGSAGLVWNPGVVETVPELSGVVQISCFPWDNGGWGFFARVYSGQDYYNVGFLDKITRLHIGTTFNSTGFFRFRRPQADAQAP